MGKQRAVKTGGSGGGVLCVWALACVRARESTLYPPSSSNCSQAINSLCYFLSGACAWVIPVVLLGRAGAAMPRSVVVQAEETERLRAEQKERAERQKEMVAAGVALYVHVVCRSLVHATTPSAESCRLWWWW